jgi:hypothetical protein
MITLVESVLINNDQSVKTDAGEFMINQRNEGYAENDGKWTVSQHAPLYWSTAGVLRSKGDEKFLGVFLTPVDVIEAIEAAGTLPLRDHMVR